MASTTITAILIMLFLATVVGGVAIWLRVRRGSAAEQEAAKRMRMVMQRDRARELAAERDRSHSQAMDRWRRNFDEDHP